jgi:hypothetical protein
MKFSKIFVAIMVLCAIVACKPTPDPGNGGGNGDNNTWSDTGSPVGEWVLTEWNGSTELPMGVYLRLNEDNTFDLYQHTSSVLWSHYSGVFSLQGTTLTGKYADGTNWAEYTIKYNEKAEPKQIKLTRKDDAKDVAIYSATEIPAEVEEQASEATTTRSTSVEKFL